MRVARWFLGLTVAFAIVGSILSSLFGDDRTYETRVSELYARAHAESVCPLNSATLESSSDSVVRACGEYGLMGYLAATRFSGASQKVFDTYGDVVEFREVLDTYGPQIVPVVYYFMEHGSAMMQAQATVSDLWTQFKQGGDIKIQKIVISPEQFGMMAIQAIKQEGHGFLGQFTFLPDGTVARVQTERVWSTVKNVLTGGIINLESKVRRGEKIAFRDGARAALDAAIIGGSAVKIFSVIKGLRTAATVTREVSTTEKMLTAGSIINRSARAVGVAAKVAAPVAVVYVMVRHPSLIASAGKLLARMSGIPEWVGVIIGWSIAGAVLAILLIPLWGLLSVMGLARHITCTIHSALLWTAQRSAAAGQTVLEVASKK